MILQALFRLYSAPANMQCGEKGITIKYLKHPRDSIKLIPFNKGFVVYQMGKIFVRKHFRDYHHSWCAEKFLPSWYWSVVKGPKCRWFQPFHLVIGWSVSQIYLCPDDCDGWKGGGGCWWTVIITHHVILLWNLESLLIRFLCRNFDGFR